MSEKSRTPSALDAEARDRYLRLLKRVLTRVVIEPETSYREIHIDRRPGYVRVPFSSGQWLLGRKNLRVMRVLEYDKSSRERGGDWPETGETMIGLLRLDNLQTCLETVIREGVPGDVLEAGVWRGGASIFMRAVLVSHGEGHRQSWLADSFQGLPLPDANTYPADQNSNFHTFDELAIAQETVRANFERFDLLDDGVHFLEGWFRDTLPKAPIEQLALLRLDGDMYESTIQALDALYHKVVAGGFIIIDDYNCIEVCKQATDDFREQHNITEPMEPIDWAGSFWRKD